MRTMIADMQVNSKVSTPLVVTSATARKTKAGKDFLNLEFYDGVDRITGNYWDWAGKNIPDSNSILNVSAQVTEYLGQKQLNVQGLSTNTDLVLAEFTPKAEADIGQAFKDCYELATDIKNDFLRQVCWEAFDTLRDKWIEVPGAKTIHHAYIGGTLIHTSSVAAIAKAIAMSMPQANVDLAVAGALLHDIGKLWTYKLDGVTVSLTANGMLKDHLYIGAKYIESLGNSLVNGPFANEEYEKAPDILQLLVHIILSHHGKQEYGSIVPPMCLEAHIVNAADMLDAAQEQIRVASKAVPGMFTDKIWGLDNRPHVTTAYVDSLFE